MNVLVSIVSISILLLNFTSTAFCASSQGDPDSSMVHFKVRVVGIDLEKEDGSFVPFYTKGGYLFTKNEGSNSLVAKLRSSYPPAGTYVGLRLTYDAFQIKLQIVKEGTTYYTTNETITHGDEWTLSTNPDDYAFITIQETGDQAMTEDFAIPLVVEESKKKNLDLSWVLQRNGIIFYDTNGTLGGGDEFTGVTWAAEEDVIRTFISGSPNMLVQFTLTVDVSGDIQENVVSILVDETGQLIGGYCHRPANKAIACENLLQNSTLTGILNDGDSADFTLRYGTADRDVNGDPVGTYILEGSYDCTTGYSLTSLTTEGTAPQNYDPNTDTPESSGSVTCKAINTQSY